MINGVECMEKEWINLNKNKINRKSKKMDFILKNMRMTICELG